MWWMNAGRVTYVIRMETQNLFHFIWTRYLGWN